MRSILPKLCLAAALTLTTVPVKAEQQTFIIANSADAYGVDRCLATGASCGNVVASAYCRSHSFSTAKSFRKIERDEITGATASDGAPLCDGRCSDFVAIECIR
ncbi:MAG TPA: hypothetical protein VHN11_12135 [Xanthobacteraceae bacterium]|jgi:hypothetical protein|nr:hypothetical protein [Xanthobacteraceae bacterium]